MTLYIPTTFTNLMRERGNSVYMGAFFRLALDPILRVWMHIQDFPTKREGVYGVGDLGYESGVDGETYLGMGRLLGMPDLEVSSDGSAPRFTMQLSGVPPEYAAMFDEEAESVAGIEARIGICPLDEYGQPLHSIIPLQTTYADVVNFAMDAGDGPLAQRTQTVSVSLGAGDGRRATPKLTSWTHAQHQILHPGDDFFKSQGRYIQGLRIAWPPAT